MLDEPVTGMNAIETEHMMDLIRKIRDSGVTILLVEHNMKAVMGLSDKITVMDFGEKITEGLPEEIAHNYKVAALKGVSFDVEEGTVVTLIGANGAGKTTIMRAITGLKYPSSGEIWFKGHRIDRLSPDKINGVGISLVPEGRRVFPQLTVMENLKMGAYLRKDTNGIQRSLESVFEHFPCLKERTRQAGGTLSGGELDS